MSDEVERRLPAFHDDVVLCCAVLCCVVSPCPAVRVQHQTVPGKRAAILLTLSLWVDFPLVKEGLAATVRFLRPVVSSGEARGQSSLSHFPKTPSYPAENKKSTWTPKECKW